MTLIAVSAATVAKLTRALEERAGIRMSVWRICAWNGMDVKAARRALKQMVAGGTVHTAKGSLSSVYWLATDALAQDNPRSCAISERGGKAAGGLNRHAPASKPEPAQPRSYTFTPLPPAYVARHLTPIVREGAGGPAVAGIVINQSAYDRDFERRPAKSTKSAKSAGSTRTTRR